MANLETLQEFENANQGFLVKTSNRGWEYLVTAAYRLPEQKGMLIKKVGGSRVFVLDPKNLLSDQPILTPKSKRRWPWMNDA